MGNGTPSINAQRIGYIYLRTLKHRLIAMYGPIISFEIVNPLTWSRSLPRIDGEACQSTLIGAPGYATRRYSNCLIGP